MHFSPYAEISRTTRELKSNVWIDARFRPQNWLPWERPLRDRELTSDRSSTAIVLPTPANWVKIGPVDVQIKDVTKSL